MKKIDILGWYNRHNVGDDAFQSVLSQWFSGHDVEFVTPPRLTRPDTDLVILGGGAVASDYYLSSINKTKEGTKIIALGVDTEWPKELDLLFEFGFDYVAFRDHSDFVGYIDRGGGEHSSFHPDLAFALTPTGTPVLRSYQQKPNKRAVAVFVTDYLMPSLNRDLYHYGPRADQFCHGFAKVLDAIAETKNMEIILVPSAKGGPADDRRVNMHLASFMKHRPTIIEDHLAPERMIDLIRGCALSMCQRYHAHIFSIIAGTPFVSIEFTKKARNITNTYQVHVPRPLLAVTRKGDGFFDFDHAYHVAELAIGSEDRATSVNYAQKCRERVQWLRESILSRFVDGVK